MSARTFGHDLETVELGVEGFVQASPSVLETVSDSVSVDDRQIAALIAVARGAPNGRARLILHPDRTDALHEMVIALPSTSLDHPHVNHKSGKSFLALSGRFAVLRFSEDGREAEATVLSAGPWPGSRMLRLRKATWHTIVPLDGDVVFLETIVGPFEGNKWASWFPPASEVAARERAVALCRAIARRAASMLGS